MRILFYIEPHPIRNSQTHFIDIARRFLPLLGPSSRADLRMFANQSTFDAIGQDKLKPYQASLIRSTADEEDLFASYLGDWNSEGIPIWMNLMSGGTVADSYLHVLRRIWSVFPFDAIVHWGENGAVTRFLNERPVTRVSMELGCTRAPFLPTLVMDLFGTNGSAVTPKLSVADIRSIVDGIPMSRHEAVFAYSQSLEAEPYEQQFLPVIPDLAAQLFERNRIAFLPLQLYDDANLLRFSKYDTLTDVVLDVVPKLAAHGYTTIIKPHPASKLRDKSDLQSAMARNALRQWSDKIIWCDRADIRYENAQLIALSDLVVTVNSSVGFEALYFDKPVVVLGDAVYKPKDLFPTLEQFLDGSFDHRAYLEGIGYLRRFFLGGYLQPDDMTSSQSTICDRISLLDQLRRKHAEDPLAIASGFYHAIAPTEQNYNSLAMFAGKSVPGVNEFSTPAPVRAVKSASQGSSADKKAPDLLLIARRLIAHIRSSDPEAFRLWLESKWHDREGRGEVVAVGQVVDVDYYLNRYPDLKEAGVDAAWHFAFHGFDEGRSPRESLSGVAAEQIATVLADSAEYLLAGRSVENEHPLTPEEEEAREKQLLKIAAALQRRRCETAVVAHLYYRDLVPEILAALKNMPEPFDLIVTLPDWGADRIEQMVLEAYPKALFYRAANRGRDIGPFIDLLPIILEQNYTALLKVQTKRGYYQAGRLLPALGHLWRKEVFECLLGSPEQVASIIEAFRANQNLNMIGPAPYYLPLKTYPYHDGGFFAESVLGEGIDLSSGGFFAGTMFWVRPSCLDPLISKAGLSIASFEPGAGANDGAKAHLVERLFGQLGIGSEQGGIEVRSGSIHDYLTRKLKEASQKKAKGALAW